MTETTDLGNALASNYLLVDMQLRSWSGKRTDRGASDELLTQKQATRDGGAFVKNLLASAGQELKEVHQMGNALRTFVYNNTLPWSSSDGAKRGERVLATTKAMDFLSDLNSLKREYDRAVMNLVAAWPARVAEAQTNLGALANPDDYPTATELPGMFSVSVDLKPIPAVADFSRLNVPADLAAALGQRHAAAAATQVANAMADLRERFVEELQRMERQLAKAGAGEKTRLYDSLVTNLQLLVDMARHMNLTGNAKLDDLVNRIESKLLQHKVDDYKDNQVLAKSIAEEAKALAVEAVGEDLWN
jgi:hypothetical protein